MYLSDSTIERFADRFDMITPFNKDRLQSGSYDCTMGGTMIDPYNGCEIESYLKDYIEPGEFLLATTEEKVKIPDNIVCQVWGKSSNARLGLFIHTTAGWVDPGFEGKLTLELYNCSNKRIFFDNLEGICQLSFARLDNHADNPYNGHYQGQDKTTRSYLDD